MTGWEFGVMRSLITFGSDFIGEFEDVIIRSIPSTFFADNQTGCTLQIYHSTSVLGKHGEVQNLAKDETN